MRWLPAALLCAVALPFHAHWIDFEASRRATLLLAMLPLALTARRWLRPPPAALWWTGALVVWAAVRTFDATNPGFGLDRTAHLTALFALACWSAGVPLQRWLWAALPVTLAVSAWGLLQAAGVTQGVHTLLLPLHRAAGEGSWTLALRGLLESGSPRDPVSTLGNLNVAAEVVAVGGAAAITLLTTGDAHRRTAWTTLALAAAYLVVNGSRSGWVALPLAAVAGLAARGVGRQRRALVLAALLAGAGCGGLAAVLATPAPEPTTGGTATDAPGDAPRPSTVRVRIELWRGTAQMIAEHPLAGVGCGQWPVHYPRYRSQQEIELSTFERAFASRPQTAHNDYLELTAETGAVGAVLGLASIIALGLAIRRRGLAAGAVLIAFGALMAVRSPLGNAPAAALAAGCAGALCGAGIRPRAGTPPGGWLWLPAAVLGVGLAIFGAWRLAAHCPAATSIRDRAVDPAAAAAQLDAAIARHPDDPSLRALRTPWPPRPSAGDARTSAAVTDDLEAMARLDPYAPTTLRTRALYANLRGDAETGLALLRQALAADPGDPESRVALAALQLVTGRTAAVVDTLFEDPHPRLRASLATRFAELAQTAEDLAAARADAADREGAQGYRAAALLYAEEALRIRGADALPDDPSTADRYAKELQELQNRLVAPDMSPLILYAAAALQRGAPAEAAVYGRRAAGLPLAERHRRLLAPLLRSLAEVEGWRDLQLQPTR